MAQSVPGSKGNEEVLLLRVDLGGKGNEEVLLLRVDLGVKAMKRYTTLPKAPILEPQQEIQFSEQDTLSVGLWILFLCRGYSHYILSLAERAEKFMKTKLVLVWGS